MEILIIGVYLPNLIHLIIPIDQSMAMIDLTSSFLGHPSMATTTVTTGNWLFADCNFLCQLFFFDTRQRGPFANWNFLQSAKQDLPTAWLCRLPGSWQRIAVGKGRPWLTPSTPSPLPTATPSAVGKGAGFANCHPPWQSAKNFYFF